MGSNLSDLRLVHGFAFPTYASEGADEIAGVIASRCQRAQTILSDALHFDPAFTLLVLSPDDWDAHARTPIYAMPHNSKLPAGTYGAPDLPFDNALIIGSQRGAFFDTMVDIAVADLGDKATTRLRDVYPGPNRGIDVAPFANLLVVHELAHLFEFQVPFRFPRRWLSEFFANLCLHAYIELGEPETMTLLQTFPGITLQASAAHWKYRSLADLERLYIGVGGENYAWFQFNLHEHAANVYNAGGIDAVRKFHTAFQNQKLREATDEQLTDFLRTNISEQAAAIITSWPS